MSIVDDMKSLLAKSSMKKDEVEKFISEIIKIHGGQYPYVRMNIAKNCRKKNSRC